MALRFCFFNGEAMPMKPGLPADYDGTVFQGSTATHITTCNGTIINQEYNNVFFSLIKTSIRCIKPEIINCVYEYPPGVFSRISLSPSIHETLLGAGRISLRKNQFSVVAGSQWQGHLELKKPGHYSFYNLH